MESKTNMFCPRCENMYDITDNVKQVLTSLGGAKSDEVKIKPGMKTIIDKIISGTLEKEDYADYVNENDILQSDEFEKLSTDEKSLVIQKMSLYVNKNKKTVYPAVNTTIDASAAYFICHNCKYYEKIQSGTLIYSKSNTLFDHIDLNMYKYNGKDCILPYDRNYTCPNDKCPTHKDYMLKQQVTKRHKTSKIIHTCSVCTTSWIV